MISGEISMSFEIHLKKSLILLEFPFDFLAEEDDDPLDFSFFRFAGLFSSDSVSSFEFAYADFILPMLTYRQFGNILH